MNLCALDKQDKYYVQLGDGASQNVQYFTDEWVYHPLVEYSSMGDHSQASAQFALGEKAVETLKKNTAASDKIEAFALWLLVQVARCEPPSASYGVPFDNFGGQNYNAADHDHDHSEPKSYEFGYAVKDDYTGNDYKRQEASDGNQVTGEYRVQLPDGRTQIVTYYADWQSGFHADVRYEGTASYPDQPGSGSPGSFPGSSGQFGVPGNQYGVPGNQFGAPGNQYGVPGNQYGVPGNQFNPPGTQYGAPFSGGSSGFGSASSSVSIKDNSGPGTPYNTNTGYGNGNKYSGGNTGFDSYANAGNFGSRTRPSNAYGAP